MDGGAQAASIPVGVPPPPSLPSVILLDPDAEEDEDSLLYMHPRLPQDRDLADRVKGLALALRGLQKSLSGEEEDGPVTPYPCCRTCQVRISRLDSRAGPSGGAGMKAGHAALGPCALVVLMPARVPDEGAAAVTWDLAGLLLFALGPASTWFQGQGRGELVTHLGPELDRLLGNTLGALFGGGCGWREALFLTALEAGVPMAAHGGGLRGAARAALSALGAADRAASERVLGDADFGAHTPAAMFRRGGLVVSHMEPGLTREVWRLCRALALFRRTEDDPRLLLLLDVFPPHDCGRGGDGGGAEGCRACRGRPAALPEGGPWRDRRALAVVGLGSDLLCAALAPHGRVRAAGLVGSPEVDACISALEAVRREGGGGDGAAPAPAPGGPVYHHVSHRDGMRGVVVAAAGNAAASGGGVGGEGSAALGSGFTEDFFAVAALARGTLRRMERVAATGAGGAAVVGGGSSAAGVGGGGGGVTRGPAGLSSATAVPLTPKVVGGLAASSGRSRPAAGGSMVFTRSLSINELASSVSSPPIHQRARRLGAGDGAAFRGHPRRVPAGGGGAGAAVAVKMAGRGGGGEFWVAGRRDAGGREAYVCYAGGASAEAVDMAFALAGWG